METMKVDLPDPLEAFVEEQLAKGGYRSASEYVCELVRREMDRSRVRNHLLDGARSSSTDPIDDRSFKPLRERIRRSSTR